MLNKDDLAAIGQLLISEREETRKIVRVETKKIITEALAANNSVIGTIVRV